MNNIELLITIFVIAFGTVITRFLPFLLFPSRKTPPDYIRYLGKVLPYSVMSLLVIYCLKSITLFHGNYGLPEIIACIFVIIVHLWKKNTLLSIIGGTIVYMLLVQLIFI